MGNQVLLNKNKKSIKLAKADSGLNVLASNYHFIESHPGMLLYYCPLASDHRLPDHGSQVVQALVGRFLNLFCYFDYKVVYRSPFRL